MAKAKKLPSGSWRVQAYIGKDNDGKRMYRSFTASTKREAEYMATEFVLNRKEDAVRRMTLEECMNRYMDNKSNVLSPSTVATYRTTMRTHLNTIKKMPIDDITQEDIQKEINQLARTLAPKTVHNIHGVLTTVFREYRPDFHFTTKLPQKKKAEATIPNEKELRMILDASAESDIELYKSILLASLIGLRRSEIVALEWTDIDFMCGTINIDKASVYDEDNNIVTKAPKTFSGYRKISAPLPLLRELSRFYQEEGKVVILEPFQITRRFCRLRDKLGLSDFTFHNLRHYFASVMLVLGVPDKYAMEYMGHSTNAMLKQVYQHTMDEGRKDAARSINAFFSNQMK